PRTPTSNQETGETMKSNHWRSASFSMPVVSLLALAVAFSARAVPPQVLTDPEVNDPIRFDVSAPLRDMAVAPARVYSSDEAPAALRPKLQQLMGAAQQRKAARADGAPQTSSGAAVLATVGAHVLGIG